MGAPSNENVRAWQSGRAYVAPLGSTAPTGVADALDAAWQGLGVLSEEDGAEWTTDETEDEFFGWGTGLARKLFSKHKRSVKVVAAEDNAVVWQLENPGSTATTSSGVTTLTVVNPEHAAQMFLIEETDGPYTRRRIVDSCYIAVAAKEDGPTKVGVRDVTVSIIPDADTGLIWTEITNDPAMVAAAKTVASIAVSPATKTLAAAATQQLAVTATYSDASTGTVTSSATYSSSAPSTATVSSTGLVTAVATGSATITATYATKTATCAVTVS